MKKTISLSLCLALAAIFLTGCVSIRFEPGSVNSVTGRGDPEMYTFSVGEVTDIRSELYCDISYYSTPSDTVTLEIQPNLREYVTLEESNGILTLRAGRNINFSGKAPVLTVSTPALKSVSQAGAGVFTAHDTITADVLTLGLSGAGASKADLDVNRLIVNSAGAGDFDLTGRADTASFNLDGAGTINALSLQTRSATVGIAGVGTVRLSVTDSLSVVADGLGTVEYKGSPVLDISRGGLVTVRNVG